MVRALRCPASAKHSAPRDQPAWLRLRCKLAPLWSESQRTPLQVVVALIPNLRLSCELEGSHSSQLCPF